MPSTTRSHGTSSMIAAAPVPALLATGPATYAYWKFDEVVGAGSPAYDTGGGGIGAAGHDLGNVNTVTAATVAPLHILNDRARGFPAAGAYMTTGNVPQLALADYFSISVWVKPAAFDAHRGVVSRLDTSTGRGWNIFISGPPTPGVVYFNVMNGPGNTAYAGGGTPLTLNVWSHIACVMGGGVRFVYINGVVQGVSSSSPMLPGLTTTDFQIGNWAEDLLSPFYGAMDDLRHYNSQLTLGNIQTLAYGLDPSSVTGFNRTHTTDSKLRGTIAKTHTTSSVLLKTITKTHTTDSRLRTTVTKTHTTDNLSRTTAIKTHTTDAALRATATKPHTTESLLQKTSTKTHTTDASLKALPSVFAQFVQRDNWRNGTWIGQYGSQGYAVFFSYQNDVMPPGVSYTRAGGTDDWWVTPGTYTDPRLPQVPNNPTQTVGSVYYAYQTTKTSTTFLFDDGLAHALSIFCLNYDAPARRQRIEVYNADTNALLDTQEVGDFYTSSIYMVWNVQGHIRFDVVLEVQSAMSTALFVDPPMSVGAKVHYADTQTIGLPVAVVRTHLTDALSRGTIFKPHNTDVWSCKTVTRTHYTDAWSCKTVTRTHYTDVLRQATATRAHFTDALVRLTVAATHTADALLRGTATRAHFTDTLVHTTVTRTHFTDTRSRATILKAHFTETWSHSTVTRTHDTSALVRTTVNKTHSTDTSTLLSITVIKAHGTDTSLAVINHLISYWKLDEGGTGQVAIDSMPLGANATDVLGTTVPSAPAPLHFTDPSGRTLPGDGTYLDTGVQPAHSFTQNFTIAGWVRPAVVDVAVVVSHMPNPLNRGWGLLLLNDATPALYACDAAGAHAVYAYGNQAPVGVWMHLAGVYYDNNTMGLFVNGRKFPANASIDPSPDLPTYIGKWCSGAPYYGASSNADFDDIRIYNIALTDAQIGSLAAGILDPLAVTVATRTHGTDAALVIPPTTVTTTHTTDASISALPSVFAQFVQRDNWRNGAWIGHYGVQGYSLFRNGIPYALPPESTIPDVMPPGVTYTMYAAYDQGLDPAVYTDPRLLQDPTRPGYTTKAIYYNGDPSRYAVFRFDDGLSHAVSLYQLDYDHEHARYTITVYDDATGTLLDGPREVGDYETTGVYLTWNVRGHIRFYSTPEVAYSYTSALFVDPPRSVGAQTHTTDTALLGAPVTVTKTHTTDALLHGTVTKTHGTDTAIFAPLITSAMFVQRDNWKNGIWKGHYGSQGVEVIYSDGTVISIPDVTYEYHYTSGSIDTWARPGVFTDPRFYQVPSDPVQTSYGVLYAAGVGQKVIITFLFDDSLAHALSIATANADTPSRRYHINVYDNDTDTLLDGPKDVGDYYTTDVYMTWNVQGHVRFECVVDNNLAGIGALFVDPPRSVGGKTHQTDALVAIAPTVVTTTHGTDASIAPPAPPTSVVEFVQRDNWLGGKWIGTYGSQGYAVFLTGTPTVLPPQVSYKFAGGRYDCWLPPGTYTDPRLPQVPGQPDKTEAAVYHTEDTECFFFNFDDGSMHAVSIFSLDYDQGDLRHQIEVYDNNTDTLLDGPRDVGDQYTNSVYMTWNVRGHVRFELVTDVENAVATAWFIDPLMSIGVAFHGTDAWISGIATVTKTHKTDSLIAGLGVGIVGSRSRSQRVGTRTLAFGDQL